MERLIHKGIRYATYGIALAGAALIGFLYTEQKADHSLTQGADSDLSSVLNPVRTASAGTAGDSSGDSDDSGNDADDAW